MINKCAIGELRDQMDKWNGHLSSNNSDQITWTETWLILLLLSVRFKWNFKITGKIDWFLLSIRKTWNMLSMYSWVIGINFNACLQDNSGNLFYTFKWIIKLCS